MIDRPEFVLNLTHLDVVNPACSSAQVDHIAAVFE